MPTLLYLHGFLSSPRSHKALQVQAHCQEHHPDIHYCCPALPPYPEACAQQLIDLIERVDGAIYLVGSSMGGFWATWLAERYGCKAVLINPAVDVMNLMPEYIQVPLQNYHNEESYLLSDDHMRQLSSYCVDEISKPSRYWLMVQKGDETLDYRQAVEKYQACRQTIEPDGDHSFKGFERFLEEIFSFFEY